MLDDDMDPIVARVREERVELMRMCAARIVDSAACGRIVDPYSLEWAQSVVRNVRPLGRHMSTGEPS